MEKIKCFYCQADLSYVRFWINHKASCSNCAAKNIEDMTDTEQIDYFKIKKSEEDVWPMIW